MRSVACVLLLLAALVAGCVSSSGPSTPAPAMPSKMSFDNATKMDVFEVRTGDNSYEVSFAPGAVGSIRQTAGLPRWTVSFPEHAFVLDGNTTFALGPAVREAAAGATLRFLAPPAMTTLRLGLADGSGEPRTTLFDTTQVPLPAGAHTRPLASGANMYAYEEIQRDNFPHRTPGQPNYAASQQYFAKFFRDLGYTVEVDKYGSDSLPCAPAALPVSACPSTMASVVATKPGDTGKILFVSGGHYDVVPATKDGAFDNTSGTVATMELARALAPFHFKHTLMFALWGGEESGGEGSESWVHGNPDAVANVESYWNLDVVGMSWPAPVLNPSPIVIAAGPDLPASTSGGATSDPISQSMLGFARTLQHDWLGFPDATANGTKMFYYEGVESGENTAGRAGLAGGGYAGVNDQSDHASFTKAGIPAYFIFNGDTLHANNPVQIHNLRDTLDNLTKVSYYGAGAADILDQPWENATLAEMGKQALIRSWDATLAFPLYYTLLVDLGVYTPPSVASSVPASVPV